MGLQEKLVQYVDAEYPIIFINTFEEEKADKFIKKAIAGRKTYEWNVGGLCDFSTKRLYEWNLDQSLFETLVYLDRNDSLNGCALVLKDVYSYLDDEHSDILAVLKNIAQRISSRDENKSLDTRIIIVSSIVKVPKVLEKYITILEMDFLTQDEIKQIIDDFANEQEVAIAQEVRDDLSMALKGLSAFEIYNILSSAYVTNGQISHADLKMIFHQKQQMVMKSGILEMVNVCESVDDIGGLENLKEWLQRKAKVYKDLNRALEYGVSLPKGVLIAGVPGCGKSLTAKVTAAMFEVPLLRLDMGKIMGKYVGESEQNMRSAIALAEAISPCVLWVDELEKAFAGINGSGNEVTVRLFGTFLTWMQEKESSVFVIATANDITKLPPELLRKGRFDEIFYVELPNKEERKKIFQIHISKRRKQDLSHIQVSKLVEKTEGYSGADIEGVVKDAIENSFVDGSGELTTEAILHSIEQTHSLSEIMKDSLAILRKTYESNKFKKASR